MSSKESEDNESNKEVSKGSVLRHSRPYIGGIQEVEFGESWNKHIKTGYRIGYKTWQSIVCSLF